MNTRKKLEKADYQLDDSIGVRRGEGTPVLSPVPNLKDVGRSGIRNFGKIELKHVVPDPHQPRVEYDDHEIEQLSLSIQQHGQLHPIRVRWSGSDQSWLIISGERRFRAAKKAGLKTIECYFHESELTNTEILEQQLIENLLRSDLRPMEEANAFQKLIRLNGWDGKTLATALRITPSKVTRSLALLKLPKSIQTLVESGDMTPTAAYELSKLPEAEQRRALSQHRGSDLSVKHARQLVGKKRNRANTRKRGVKQVFSTEEGWKVVVSSDRKGNYHEIAEALRLAMEEVQLRIDNNVVLS
jgi:ParB family chromosome partitioning protein